MSPIFALQQYAHQLCGKFNGNEDLMKTVRLRERTSLSLSILDNSRTVIQEFLEQFG